MESGEDANEMNKKIKKVMEKVKFSCFGKVSVSKQNAQEKEVDSFQKEKIPLSQEPPCEANGVKMENVNVKLANVLS